MLCRYRHGIRNADILVMPLGLPTAVTPRISYQAISA